MHSASAFGCILSHLPHNSGQTSQALIVFAYVCVCVCVSYAQIQLNMCMYVC